MYTYRLVDDGINVFRDSMPAANVVYVAANGLFAEPKISGKGLGGGRPWRGQEQRHGPSAAQPEEFRQRRRYALPA